MLGRGVEVGELLNEERDKDLGFTRSRGHVLIETRSMDQELSAALLRKRLSCSHPMDSLRRLLFFYTH